MRRSAAASNAGCGVRRSHIEVIAGRTVSFLELFYDLVYVAVITQAAHHLAEHVSARGVGEFAVVFALIWIAWINGTIYLDLHGREDGRTRNIVFVQMGLLVLLAVFTADAADGSGSSFAVTYAAFLAVLTWLWNTVRRQDRARHPEFLADTGRYVAGIGLSVAVILASAFLPTGPRLVVWAGFACVWVVAMMLVARSGPGMARALSAYDVWLSASDCSRSSFSVKSCSALSTACPRQTATGRQSRRG